MIKWCRFDEFYSTTHGQYIDHQSLDGYIAHAINSLKCFIFLMSSSSLIKKIKGDPQKYLENLFNEINKDGTDGNTLHHLDNLFYKNTSFLHQETGLPLAKNITTNAALELHIRYFLLNMNRLFRAKYEIENKISIEPNHNRAWWYISDKNYSLGIIDCYLMSSLERVDRNKEIRRLTYFKEKEILKKLLKSKIPASGWGSMASINKAIRNDFIIELRGINSKWKAFENYENPELVKSPTSAANNADKAKKAFSRTMNAWIRQILTEMKKTKIPEPNIDIIDMLNRHFDMPPSLLDQIKNQ
jgi:hypothetical protein